MRKQDICNVDLFTGDDLDRGMTAAVRHAGQGRDATNSANYVQAVIYDRIVHDTEVSQGEFCESHNVKQANLSKQGTVIRAIRWHLEGDSYELKVRAQRKGETTVEKLPGQAANLLEWWSYSHGDDLTKVPSFHDFAKGLIGDDGEKRIESLKQALEVYGAPSSAYRIANGEVFHPADPRSQVDADDDGDTEGEDGEAGEEGDGEGETTPWQDRMTALVAQATLEGATPSEILAVVNAALKQ